MINSSLSLEHNLQNTMTVVPSAPTINGIPTDALHTNGASGSSAVVPMTIPAGEVEALTNLEKDYYGCYCLKFIVKNGTHITEEKVVEDFGVYGEVVDVRGPGLFSGLRGNHVYVRFIDKADAEEALKHLGNKYHQLTPASISDVLPDNYGLYTISFYNKTGIPSAEVRKEFSKFGEVKNLTGSLDVKGGRVFVSYKEKVSAVTALQAFFFRKDKYPNMKFALPRCEKDYFGCYCLKFYNKSGDITEEKVLKDFGQFGEVVDIRGPGLFDVTGDDVYVRYKDKSSAEQALIELVGKYDSLCLAPPSDIQADKFGYYTITFVNDKCLSKSDVWYIFSKFGTVACVNGTFDCKKGRVFVSYKEKQGALNALETMLITKEYHLQVSKNSTVRKSDYNGTASSKDLGSMNDVMNGHGDGESNEPNGMMHSSRIDKFSNGSPIGRHQNMHNHNGEEGNIHHHHLRTNSLHRTPLHHRDNSRGRDVPNVPVGVLPPIGLPSGPSMMMPSANSASHGSMTQLIDPNLSVAPPPLPHGQTGKSNGLVKFNRNVEKDIFGYFCLSFLNEDGDISEKKVRNDFGKFGEVVSVRGALGKQKGHVFVRFRKKEAAENCLNCLNSFPLSEMSELFGKYLFLSPATPRDIDCDMYGLYSISFLNLNAKPFREISQEFSKFGEIVRLTSGGSINTDELVSISYADKNAAIKALQVHFTNKEYPYLDIAKGSSLLLVNSSDSSDNEENESDYLHRRGEYYNQYAAAAAVGCAPKTKDPFHDPSPSKSGNGGSDIVDELLKPLQSYFNIYRTGQYGNQVDGATADQFMNGHHVPTSHRSPDKKYRIRSIKNGNVNHLQPVVALHPPPPVTFAECMKPPPSASVHPIPDAGFTCPPPPITSNGRPSAMPHHISAQTDGGSLSTPTNIPPPPIPASMDLSMLAPVPDDVCVSNSEEPAHLNIDVLDVQGDLQSLQISNEDYSRRTEIRPVVESMDNNVQEEIQPEPEPIPPVCTEDIFGLYSLAFVNKSKDLSERRIKVDFSKYGEVVKIRGQFGTSSMAITNGSGASDIIVVSYSLRESAQTAVETPALIAKYPSLKVAPPMEIVTDKNGHFSIDFGNSAMSSIREITNVFARHGDVKEVSVAGAKNEIKRVTVSFQEKDSALEAIRCHANSKDFIAVDFSKECLMLRDPQLGILSQGN